jgi:hypothetical protein
VALKIDLIGFQIIVLNGVAISENIEALFDSGTTPPHRTSYHTVRLPRGL